MKINIDLKQKTNEDQHKDLKQKTNEDQHRFETKNE
jgi:hypothetical protein